MPSGSAIAADGDGEGSDDFYERIEAPKFFDFTVPDLFDADDRYWFCRRVGCDQKHEEEIDPEKVFQTFVQQVLAARSPNVRLQKAQNKKCPSSGIKDFTLSAPAKPSKPRLLGPPVGPSLSRKMNEAELKVRPPLPNPKPKQSVAASKCLTVPRNKKGFPNPDSFPCVKDTKISPSIEVPKNKVAKVPRKVVRLSISQELKTPLSKLCRGIKWRETASQQKRLLQQSIIKKTRNITRDYDKPWRLNTASKLRCGKAKKPANDKEARSSLDSNVENRGTDLQDSCGPLSYDEVDGNDLSDMDIDEKSRIGSLGAKSLTDGDTGCCGSKKHSPETTASAASGADMNSQLNSQESDPDDNGASNRQDSKGENCQGNKEHRVEARGKKCAREKVPDELLPGSHPTKEAFHGRQTNESDEKQIESASDDYKENSSATYSGLTFACDHLPRKGVGSHATYKTIQKSTPTPDKTCEDRSISAITCTRGLKYKRSKPTNPILFRLQTDERGILKEANLDRGLQNVEPKKETPTVSKIISTNSQKRQRNELSHQNRTAETDPSKVPMELETGTGTTSQRRAIKTPGMPKLVKGNNDEFEKSENSKKTEPLSSRQRVAGASSTRKRTISVMKPRRLSLDKESSALELRSKIKASSSKLGGATIVAKASTSVLGSSTLGGATIIAKASTSVLGSSTRERSITTVSMKLNSNSVLHVPKSCIKTRP